MYTKNLSEDLRLRLSLKDMDFLKGLAQSRDCSVSEVIRSIIGEYRRGMEAVNAITKAMELLGQKEDGHGVTETFIDNKL